VKLGKEKIKYENKTRIYKEINKERRRISKREIKESINKEEASFLVHVQIIEIVSRYNTAAHVTTHERQF
jgi:adenine-specific DNA methylase